MSKIVQGTNWRKPRFTCDGGPGSGPQSGGGGNQPQPNSWKTVIGSALGGIGGGLAGGYFGYKAGKAMEQKGKDSEIEDGGPGSGPKPGGNHGKTAPNKSKSSSPQSSVVNNYYGNEPRTGSSAAAHLAYGLGTGAGMAIGKGLAYGGKKAIQGAGHALNYAGRRTFGPHFNNPEPSNIKPALTAVGSFIGEHALGKKIGLRGFSDS